MTSVVVPSDNRLIWRRNRRRADPTADHRVDLYSGRHHGVASCWSVPPPFIGNTQQMITSHLTTTAAASPGTAERRA